MTEIFGDFSISMIQPSGYKNFLKRKKSAVALFVIILVTVSALANVVFPIFEISRMTTDFYNHDVPYFKVENGEFFVEDDIEIIDKPFFIGLSNEKSYKKDDTNGFDIAILVDKENFIMKNNSGVYSYRIKDLGNDITFDKNSVYMFKNIFVWILVFFGIFMYAISYLGFFIGVWLVKWLSSSFSRTLKLNLTSSELFRLAIYSRTVPVLLGALLNMWRIGFPYILSLIVSEIYLYIAFISMKKNSEEKE